MSRGSFVLPDRLEIFVIVFWTQPLVQRLVLPKHLGGEYFDGCALLPRISGKPGFVAGLLEECHMVPIVFDRNLR